MQEHVRCTQAKQWRLGGWRAENSISRSQASFHSPLSLYTMYVIFSFKCYMIVIQNFNSRPTIWTWVRDTNAWMKKAALIISYCLLLLSCLRDYNRFLEIPVRDPWKILRVTRNSKLDTRNSKLDTRYSKLDTRNSRLDTRYSRLDTRNSKNIENRGSSFESRLSSYILPVL